MLEACDFDFCREYFWQSWLNYCEVRVRSLLFAEEDADREVFAAFWDAIRVDGILEPKARESISAEEWQARERSVVCPVPMCVREPRICPSTVGRLQTLLNEVPVQSRVQLTNLLTNVFSHAQAW